MIIARQSTARTVTVGPVLDADGVAVTDGVVADFKIAKNGAAPAALNGSATLTHRNTGHYSLSLTTSDLDTVGQAEIVIDDTVNACPVKEITVIEEVVYDALYAASANTFTGAAGSNAVRLVDTTTANTDMRGTDGAYTGTPPAAAAIADAVCDEALSGHTSAGSVGAALSDVYYADINFNEDDSNNRDEYTITWFKNDARVPSGITVPTIQVVKRADGSDLVASSTPTQIGSTGSYMHDESSNRLGLGEAALVIVTATIDGASRSWSKLVSRDKN